MKTLRAIKQLQWTNTELHVWTGYVQYYVYSTILMITDIFGKIFMYL